MELGITTFVFSSPRCPACHRVKTTLEENGVVYRDIDISENVKAQKTLHDVTGRRSVPVVFVNGTYIGGADELIEAVTTRALETILKRSPARIPYKIEGLLAHTAGKTLSTLPGTSEKTGAESPAKKSGHDESSGSTPERVHELEDLALKMADKKKGLKSSGVFSGAEACEWLIKNCDDVPNQLDAAIAKGRELQDAHLLSHATFSEPFSASSEEFFHLITQDNEPSISSALNARRAWVKPTREAPKVAAELRKRILSLYAEALSADGRSVNYKALAKSGAFKRYVQATGELQRVDLFALNRNEKMAFFINIYNSLVIHALVEIGPPNSFFKRMGFFRGNKYHIGGSDYSLDDIENGVLRANRAPASRLIKNPVFNSSDPRRFHALVPLDPRIHFTLVCGAVSCPPIKLYTPDNLEQGLEAAGVSFCEGEVKINLDEMTIMLSKIFEWYKDDFGKTPKKRLAYIARFLSKEKQRDLKQLIEKGDFKIQYSEYNWSVND